MGSAGEGNGGDGVHARARVRWCKGWRGEIMERWEGNCEQPILFKEQLVCVNTCIWLSFSFLCQKISICHD